MSESQVSSVTTYDAPLRHLHVVPPAAANPEHREPAWARRLSRRETEVLLCIGAGLSTDEIAATLFISVATVKSHIARLICKVEVRDRLQLVVEAYRTGFIPVG
ncbi:response regulator transcription factor [Nocardioides stalactiti]|uniref:response regulator transcription factor n=1 Tax=Nocardioides stalactiti TaxID=2755356 RepID=UPI0015FF4910|nr:helix-turn-helix transcriptional regulator [Nocardioides stalactiti]